MADTFGWRVTFALVSVLTAVLMASMAVSLPRNSHPAKIGFLRQFRLFFDRRIQLGVADVVFGAAASYVFLADKGHGVEPLTHIRPIYCVQAVCLCLLAFASLLAVGATTLLRPYVER